jgi:hypothetical protein
MRALAVKEVQIPADLSARLAEAVVGPQIDLIAMVLSSSRPVQSALVIPGSSPGRLPPAFPTDQVRGLKAHGAGSGRY